MASSLFLLFSIWISFPGGSVLFLFLLCSPNLSRAASIFHLCCCPLSSTGLCSGLVSKICTAASFSQPWHTALVSNFPCTLPLLPSCNSLCFHLCLVHLLNPPLIPMENKLSLPLGICGHNRRQKTPSRDYFLLYLLCPSIASRSAAWEWFSLSNVIRACGLEQSTLFPFLRGPLLPSS